VSAESMSVAAPPHRHNSAAVARRLGANFRHLNPREWTFSLSRAVPVVPDALTTTGPLLRVAAPMLDHGTRRALTAACSSDDPQYIAVTGASSGIGLEFVRQYAAAAATHVFAMCRNPSAAAELQAIAAATAPPGTVTLHTHGVQHVASAQ
jgi:hypothetical protein